MRERIDVPTVLVTHDVSEAFALCDDMVLLGEGERVMEGAVVQSVRSLLLEGLTGRWDGFLVPVKC